MVKIAIMQPYFLPYIGYWQLIKSVDKFVVFDDVNFIKKGWINRNNFLINNDVKLVSVPLIGASQNKLIKDILIFNDKQYSKTLDLLKLAYSKTKNFDLMYPDFKSIMSENSSAISISELNVNLMKWIMNILSINTEIVYSSSLEYNRELKGQQKIIAICKELQADTYFNLPGGKTLYDEEKFREHQIKLNFITPIIKPYTQFNRYEFVKNLSIFDLLMQAEKKNFTKYIN